MGWGEFVYLGYVGKVGNPEDSYSFCDKFSDDIKEHVCEEFDSVDTYMVYIADKIGMTVDDELIYGGPIIKMINKYIKNKYCIDVNLVHSHEHGKHSYVAFGIDIENLSYDDISNQRTEQLISILKEIFSVFDINMEPIVAKTDYIVNKLLIK